MPQLLTVKQLAEYLKISPKTIYNMVSLERIPYVKAGGALRFIPSDIDKWLKSGIGTKDSNLIAPPQKFEQFDTATSPLKHKSPLNQGPI